MDWKVVLSAFAPLFGAELGAKARRAFITMTARTHQPWAGLLGAVVALAAVSVIGVIAGSVITRFIPIEWVSKGAAVAFIAIGVLMLFGKL